MSTTDDGHRQTGLTGWWLAAVLGFSLAGTGDWLLALNSSPDVDILGLGAGWLVFVALWAVGASIWAVSSGLILWAATGTASLTPGLATLRSTAQRWWAERHDIADAQRLATAISAAAAIGGFAMTSILLSAQIIEGRTIPWLIATTTLIVQLILAVGWGLAALALRRGLLVVLRRLRQRSWLSWFNTPAMVGASLIATAVTCALVIRTQRDLFLAVEGPAISLVVGALLLHLIAAHTVDRRAFSLPTPFRIAIWLTPVLALLVVGLVSQQPDARRMLVLHGESASFAFNGLQRHTDLDRFFDRRDCPPFGPDGLPADGTTLADYQAQCMNPSYDRPFARQAVPDYDRPHLEDRPSFLFITWDSVRVDRVGFMGHHRDTTPNLDAFADRSLVFDRAFTADSGTGPSFWSLMAGKTPFQVNLVHGNQFPPPIDDDEPMLGRLLDEAGYHNEAVMCGRVFEKEQWGIRRGFERFENVCGSNRHHLAPMVSNAAIETLNRLVDREEPFFLWVHYYDPHTPYTNHPEIGYGEERLDRYDEELKYTDHHMQDLLDHIDDITSHYDRPLFTIFGADHGENFDEHGSDPHARNLYRIVTQIPKLVHGPGIEPGRIDPPVAFNDVYPSVLDLAGIEIPDEATMVSQVPVYFGAPPDAERMVFQENSYSRPRRHTRAVIYDRYHYIMDLTTHTNELYDYVDDPIEKNNLIGTGLIEERIMRQALVQFLQTSTIPPGLED